MKTKIRRNVFETNSSSVHTLSICKAEPINFPEVCVFDEDSFGWEQTTLTDTSSKANYIWELLISGIYEKDVIQEKIDHITEVLEDIGVKAIFPHNYKMKEVHSTYNPEYVYLEFYNENGDLDEGYVDHASEAKYFIEDVLSDNRKLINFLFNPNSFILTGNDNSDEYDPAPNFEDAWEYEKGN